MSDTPSSLEFRPRATGSVMGFPAHEGRPAALGEVHARPHPLMAAPRVLIQLSFMTEGGSSVDHAVLTELSMQLGIAAPDRQARHHAMKWGNGSLRWERHTEFSTYLWEGPLPGEPPVRPQEDSPFGNGFSPPGTVISGIRLEIRKWTAAAEKLIAGFDSRPAVLFAGRARQGGDRHRFPAGRRRPDAHAHPRSRADPAAPARCRSASSTSRPTAARLARPAAGPVAVGQGAAHRGQAGRHLRAR